MSSPVAYTAPLRPPVLPARARAGAIRAFMIPPVFGDEPQLQDLRHRLRGLMEFDVLSLPDAHASGKLLTDMVGTGRTLTDVILSRQPTGPIALMGLSFGASMTLEVATQLECAGREVVFLGILDGPFEPPEFPRAGISPLAMSRRLVKTVVVDAAESMDTMRRLMLTAVAPRASDGGKAEPMRRAMLWHLRNKALKYWRPQGCRAQGLHVYTDTYGPSNRARWAELCPHLESIHVDAVHEHLLKDDALEVVASALIAVIEGLNAPCAAVA